MALQLVSFDPGPPPDAGEPTPLDAPAAHAQMAGFERGYAAGWEDATAAEAASRARLTDALLQSVETAAFTLAEARAQVLSGLRPVLSDAFAQLLPRAARASLPGMVAEVLLPLLAEAADVPLRLRTHPGCRAAIEAALAGGHAAPLEILDDPALPDHAACIEVGDGTVTIDPGRAAAAIAGAADIFLTLYAAEHQNG